MTKKKIKIEILPDGTINAETNGMKGKECLKYIKILETMLDSETVDSEFLKEYYEKNNINTNIDEKLESKQRL